MALFGTWTLVVTARLIDSKKCEANHELQLLLSKAYYHFCLPHGMLSKRHARQTTPFMSAGLTDHVWTMRELLETSVENT